MEVIPHGTNGRLLELREVSCLEQLIDDDLVLFVMNAFPTGANIQIGT